MTGALRIPPGLCRQIAVEDYPCPCPYIQFYTFNNCSVWLITFRFDQFKQCLFDQINKKRESCLSRNKLLCQSSNARCRLSSLPGQQANEHKRGGPLTHSGTSTRFQFECFSVAFETDTFRATDFNWISPPSGTFMNIHGECHSRAFTPRNMLLTNNQ